LTRKLDDWLTGYLDYTENSEAPLSYHVWTGISCIAGALQRKVWINWPLPIYPNQFIILVGPSGHARKNDAIQTGKAFLRGLNIPTIADDNTPESIIQQLAKECEGSYLYEGTARFHTSATAFAPELATFTGNKNSRFLVYLTDWYDSADKWERRTKHEGRDEITGLCFNLLGATAPDWLPYILTEEATGGGFTSRCIFIVESDKGKIIADPNLNKPSSALKERLTHDIEAIQMMIGEFTFDPEGYERYTSWYTDTMERDKEGDWAINDPLFRGYCARRATHVKKIGMCISASEGSSMQISLAHFDRAISLLENAEQKMPKVFSSLGSATYVKQTTEVMEFIRVHGTVSKGEVMRQFYRSVDSTVLEVVIKVLVDMQKIYVDITTGETKYVYVTDISTTSSNN
jgi:hypothetical protein